ncbi:30S ribosomal protein S6 [bacterium]|nr:30S ribosomal protein S6 [bacterium]
MNKPYETTFIVDAHLSNEQIESVITKYSKTITDNNGTIKLIDRWGKRRLAYEIAKKQYGYYVYIRFDAEGSLIKVLEREFRLDDNVIRYLTITLPAVAVKQESETAPSQTEKPDAPSEPKGESTEKSGAGEDPEAVSSDESEKNEDSSAADTEAQESGEQAADGSDAETGEDNEKPADQ